MRTRQKQRRRKEARDGLILERGRNVKLPTLGPRKQGRYYPKSYRWPMLYKSGRHPDGPRSAHVRVGSGAHACPMPMLSQVACHPMTHIFGNHNFAKENLETTCNDLGNCCQG